MKRLEDRFVYNEEVFLRLDGIIVLGGGTDSGKVAKDRNEYSLGEGSERIIKGLEFVRKKPQGTVIFTGFSEALIHEGLSEAEIIEKLIEALNLDSTNIVFEKRSRNTFENASYTSEIINELQIKKWGIVTSAIHMKRAIEAFKHQNSEKSFDPIPVDFRTKNSIYWGPGKMQRSLNFWRIYIHETIGYWVYKLTGRL
ncbi:YdcF family protein [Paracoccaceae bacterium]|nr:YdcF family protein [Paracoccaceae bacterium]